MDLIKTYIILKINCIYWISRKTHYSFIAVLYLAVLSWL